MTIERYSHVMHITSNVTGQLADGKDAFDALRACLPAGTVSGAPKVRAMQIIDELEPHRRGPVCRGGRLFRLQRQHGHLHRPADDRACRATRPMCRPARASSPTAVPAVEYQETLNKARGLLKAIELTERRLRGPG